MLWASQDSNVLLCVWECSGSGATQELPNPSLQVGPCTVYKCKALTEDALRVLGAGGEGAEHFAWIRAGHAACIAEGKLVYVFGGGCTGLCCCMESK